MVKGCRWLVGGWFKFQVPMGTKDLLIKKMMPLLLDAIINLTEIILTKMHLTKIRCHL